VLTFSEKAKKKKEKKKKKKKHCLPLMLIVIAVLHLAGNCIDLCAWYFYM
jgi:flagellar basal body-associated protein FliL